MSVFVDTNVVVYAFDAVDPRKRALAIDVLQSGEHLVVSTQVLLETWWILTRRLDQPLDEDTASEVIDRLSELPVVAADTELVRRAVRSARRHHVTIWDSMIIEAARSGGCDRLLTEDLQHGRDFSGVLIENPFRA